MWGNSSSASYSMRSEQMDKCRIASEEHLEVDIGRSHPSVNSVTNERSQQKVRESMAFKSMSSVSNFSKWATYNTASSSVAMEGGDVVR